MKKERPQFNQVNVARKRMELDFLFFYKFIVCYGGMPFHFVGTESYKKRYRIFLTAVK